jgi:hypothetical protein
MNVEAEKDTADISLSAYQRGLIIRCVPDVGRSLRTQWQKDIRDCLRPLRQIVDADVLGAIRFACERLWKKEIRL